MQSKLFIVAIYLRNKKKKSKTSSKRFKTKIKQYSNTKSIEETLGKYRAYCSTMRRKYFICLRKRPAPAITRHEPIMAAVTVKRSRPNVEKMWSDELINCEKVSKSRSFYAEITLSFKNLG